MSTLTYSPCGSPGSSHYHQFRTIQIALNRISIEAQMRREFPEATHEHLGWQTINGVYSYYVRRRTYQFKKLEAKQ